MELNAGGTWDIGWTDFGMNFSSLENSKTFGFLPGVLTQDVDLSLNLEMDSHWFFNGYFSKSFSRNFFSAGYKNTDKTHNNIIDEITIGNLAGNRFATQAFGRAASPLARNAFSTISGQATEYAVDGIKNQYHNYNK